MFLWHQVLRSHTLGGSDWLIVLIRNVALHDVSFVAFGGRLKWCHNNSYEHLKAEPESKAACWLKVFAPKRKLFFAIVALMLEFVVPSYFVDACNAQTLQ